MSEIESIIEVMRLVRVLTELAENAIDAATSENPQRVQDILPPQLETSIAKLRAEIEAHQKFGPRT
jgi:phage terminase small subunit